MKTITTLQKAIESKVLFWIESGIYDSQKEYDKRRIRILNIINMALLFFSALFISGQFIFYKKLSLEFALIESLSLPTALLSFYLTKKRFFTPAKLVTIIVNITIVLVLKVFYNNTGMELAGLLGIIAAIFLFEKKVLVFGVSLFSIVSYIVMHNEFPVFEINFFSLELLHQLATLIFIFLILYSLRLQIIRYHKTLSKQQKLLLFKNNELNELNSLKTRLFSIVSHDLKSPMNAFELYLKEFKKNNLSTEELQSIFPEMLKDVESINGLIKNLLQWSQNQLTEQKIKCERLNIAELIEHNCRLFELQASHKKIKLQASLANEYLVAYGDRNITDTIIRNLMSNAIKFSHTGTFVNIAAAAANEVINISITDYGQGMTPEQIADIYNLKGNTTFGTHSEKGSGLGLLLAQQLLQKQGCQLTISSKPDEGTTMSFVLPKYRQELVAV